MLTEHKNMKTARERKHRNKRRSQGAAMNTLLKSVAKKKKKTGTNQNPSALWISTLTILVVFTFFCIIFTGELERLKKNNNWKI